MKKKIINFFALLLVIFGVFISGIKTSAAIMENRVLWYYRTTQIVSGPQASDKISYSNHKYMDIRFRNGYYYTETSKNISSLLDVKNGIRIIEYVREYKTY